MAHRQLLTDEERQALLGIPLDADSMARCFTLSRADRHLVAARRRDANRIGFAVQLALLRHPGIALAQLEQPVNHSFSGWQSSLKFQPRRSPDTRVAHKP
jgi:TnpA family transposase